MARLQEARRQEQERMRLEAQRLEKERRLEQLRRARQASFSTHASIAALWTIVTAGLLFWGYKSRATPKAKLAWGISGGCGGVLLLYALCLAVGFIGPKAIGPAGAATESPAQEEPVEPRASFQKP